MSPEEAAFLEALKANPADDTTRLVYADWLDEHSEHAKAEYLRTIVELAQTSTTATEPFVTMAGELPADWRLDTAARFSLVLESFELGTRNRAITVVREITDMGLPEARQFVEQAPSWFPFRTTAESADGLVHYFSPGRVRIDPGLTSGAPTLPIVATFAVWARLEYSNTRPWNYPPEARAAFRTFVASALGVNREIAAELAGRDCAATLGTELVYQRARENLRRYSDLLPEDSEDQWEIMLGIRPVLTKPAR